MRRTALCAAVLAIALAGGPAVARGQFVAYDDADAVWEGEGGLLVAHDGIDFWTDGTPSRRFQILGTLTESRSGIAAGQAVGSPNLARQARALGGDALILVGRRERDGGFVGGWSGGDTIAPFVGSRASSTATTFAVVRYLD